MKPATRYTAVWVTAPGIAVARTLARTLLDEKLAACVNLVPGLESHYRWKGAVESAREVLMIIKTRRTLLARLERRVRELHPYDTPEVLALPLLSGSAGYLDWIQSETC